MSDFDWLAANGSTFYKDDYGVHYNVNWEVEGNMVDMTTIIKNPFIYGQERTGYIKNKVLFRYGIITVQRLVFSHDNGSFEIIAEGSTSYEDYFQDSFQCGGGPNDGFLYHLNNYLTDRFEVTVTAGSHWADADDETDDVIWGDVDGDVTVGTSGDFLIWDDVWSSI